MDKRYDHRAFEHQMREKWEKEQTYKKEYHKGPLWSIDTPPPTVSGTLHIGHIFSYSQTDILARYKRMNGFSVFYPFGFDDNGLPTERYVEKKCKVNAHKIGRSKFIELCLQETKEAEEQFKDLWQRIGLSVDWDACYSTISKETRAISQASFIQLLKKGYVYRKHEPALYCTTCRTSVAQAELDDTVIPSTFNDLIFQDQDGNDLIISTTRPELLPSCVAVFYHPEDERYQDLDGKKAIVPFFNIEVPILPDELVDKEKGTGLVMCCTFGDKADIFWFKKHNLPYKQSIGFDGKMTADTQLLAGLKVKDARQAILQELLERNKVLKQKPIEHAVNVHERCKKEIEFVMLPQWFLNILDYKQEFIKQAELINWYPAFMKARYIDWVQNISWDWCLSRQRYYGIPFPVWHVEDTDAFLVPPLETLPIDPLQQDYPGEVPPEFKGKKLIPDTDVMDTWNTSSLTPYICFQLFDHTTDISFDDPRLRDFIPMSMRPQAHDIIRTWAFYTIVKVWMHNKQIPWEHIVISGHVLADGKEKLSKSKDQKAFSPERLLQQYPADVIRFWTASGNLGHDVVLSENQLKIGQRLVTKLWNAFRFIKEHISSAQHKEEPTSFGLINEWLLHEITQTFNSYQNYLEKNEFGLALGIIEQFFWHAFCDNYLELIKDQLFHPENYDHEELFATRWTLYHVGLRILQLFAPYMPFATESIYGLVYQDGMDIDSIHKTKYAQVQVPYNFVKQAKTMNYILHVIAQVRKLKSQHQLSLKTELQTLTIYAQDEEILKILKQQEQLVKGATKAGAFFYKNTPLDQAQLKRIENEWQAHVIGDL